MKIYSVSIWPNNQPPIFIGDYKAKNKQEAIQTAAKENNVPYDKSWLAEIKSKNSSINKWKKLDKFL